MIKGVSNLTITHGRACAQVHGQQALPNSDTQPRTPSTPEPWAIGKVGTAFRPLQKGMGSKESGGDGGRLGSTADGGGSHQIGSS